MHRRNSTGKEQRRVSLQEPSPFFQVSNQSNARERTISPGGNLVVESSPATGMTFALRGGTNEKHQVALTEDQ
jgi:hypothetical protein